MLQMKLIFVCWKMYALISDPNSMLTHPCNVQFTMYNFAAHSAYFSFMSRLQYFTFFNINLTTWRMLMLYFENPTFGVITSSSGQVGSQKTDPWTSM